MQLTVKFYQIFWLRESSSFYHLRCHDSFVSKQLQSKRRILVMNKSLLFKFIGRVSFIEFKRVLFHWWNSDSVEGNAMLFQCLSTDAKQIECVLKIYDHVSDSKS